MSQRSTPSGRGHDEEESSRHRRGDDDRLSEQTENPVSRSANETRQEQKNGPDEQMWSGGTWHVTSNEMVLSP